MILVDKEIKRRSHEIFQEGYDETNVRAISYDLHIQGIVTDESLADVYVLRPGEVVFIKTKEKISMPTDLMGRIGEKNSRMRQGLIVAGPHYYPGHNNTYLFLRVQNATFGTIKIKKGDEIAQIIFEQLSDVPEKDYSQQSNASFNDEDDYRGLAEYKDEYEDRMAKIKDADKKLDKKIDDIYANILTIMGLFVSVFSLVMVNFTNISDNNMTRDFIVPMNISLGIVITLFVGLLLIFINKAQNKWFLAGYIVLMVALIIGLFSTGKEEKYYKEYNSIGSGVIIVDDETQIIFGLDDINELNEGDLAIAFSNSNMENIENVEVGFEKTFVIDGKNYQFVLTSVDHVSRCYSVVLKEI